MTSATIKNSKIMVTENFKTSIPTKMCISQKGGKKGKHTRTATSDFTDISTGTGLADLYDVKAAVVGGVDSATGTSDNVVPTATATGLSKLKLAKRQAYSATTASGLDHSTETGTGTPTTAIYTPSESGMGTGGMPSGMPTQGSSPEQWMEYVLHATLPF